MSDTLLIARRRLEALSSHSKTPGIQYMVVNAKGPVLEYTGGLADLRHQTPLTAATTMMAYSMSKTVTAIAVLQLVETGRIGLDDPVGRYLDAIPYDDRVTLRTLISHTSGVPNPIPLRWVHPAAQHAAFDEDAALRGILRAHPRLAFEPGSRYRYSNIGYWLLGKVVARAGGTTFATYVNDHILCPLGLSPAELSYAVTDPAHHATGYLEKYSFINLVKGLLIDRALIGDYSGRWLEIRSHYPNGAAFGGLVGTAGAFGRLLQDQLGAQSLLLGAEGRHLLYSAHRTTSGAPVPMTMGWHIGSRNGARHFFKEGGGGGFHSMMRLYPDHAIGTVVIANATAFNVRQLLDSTDPLFFNAGRNS